MYEHLESLNSIAPELLSELRPLTPNELEDLLKISKSFPMDYLIFLKERGHGVWNENESSLPALVFVNCPINAAKDYYFDDQIYTNNSSDSGAKGVVWIFAMDSVGTAFGFDSGDNWRLLEIDNYRNINHIEMTFKQFIEGCIVCYPQTPIRYSGNGIWIDMCGEAYSIPSFKKDQSL